MTSKKSYIHPLLIELNETVKDTVYFLALPKSIKDKWIQLERKSKLSYNSKYNLPTNTLKELFSTFSGGVVAMNPVSEQTDDTRWLASFTAINVNIVVNCFKIWVEEFYVHGSIVNYKRRNGDIEEVSKLAKELIELLKTDSFEPVYSKEIVLFDNGKAVNNYAYQLYPLRVVDGLIGKRMTLKGVDTKLLYSSNNELITDTKDFHYKNDFYSFVVNLSVQTLPPVNKAYLKVAVSVRRWICRNSKGSDIFLPNNKNCYVRVNNDRMQVMRTVYNREIAKNQWNSSDLRCFDAIRVSSELPNFTDVLAKPEEYNQGGIGDVLIPYEEGLQGITTQVKSGSAFVDRDEFFKVIKEQIYHLDGITSNVIAEQVKKTVQNRKKDFIKKVGNEINSDVFLTQLNKALDKEKLTIEIYAESEMRKEILDYLQLYFGKNTKHEINCYHPKFYEELDKTSMSKSENLPGFEKRIKEITDDLNHVSTPTLALVAIHDKNYYKRLNYKINLDPKDAIRAGFAKTGRLTQFITFEEFENQQKEKLPAEKTAINQTVQGAVLDGFRQLGITFNYENNSRLKGKKITGVHICNHKRTKYLSIPPFPIIVTYNIDQSRLMVYSDLIDKVEVPYWKGMLALAELATERDRSIIKKNLSNTSLYRRLNRLINDDDKDHVIIFDANGTSRKRIKGIANSNLDSAEKNKFQYVSKILLTDNQILDFSEAKNKISVIRLRHNNEVSSYIPMKNESDASKYKQVSGLFKLDKVYYSIDGRPQHESKVYDKDRSKSTSSLFFSHRNMVEIYPIYVSGDEISSMENELEAVGIVDVFREASLQYTTQKTVLPFPLHLAMKMEEYI